jgi:hypothetical protein
MLHDLVVPEIPYRPLITNALADDLKPTGKQLRSAAFC